MCIKTSFNIAAYKCDVKRPTTPEPDNIETFDEANSKLKDWRKMLLESAQLHDAPISKQARRRAKRAKKLTKQYPKKAKLESTEEKSPDKVPISKGLFINV